MKHISKRKLWFILATGIIVSFFLSVFTYQYEAEKKSANFNLYSNLVFDEITSAFGNFENINKSISYLLDSSGSVDENQFGLFTRSILVRNPFIEHIYYAPHIVRSDINKIELDKRKSGYAGFSFRSFKGRNYAASPIKNSIFPIEYVQPYNVRTSILIGQDILTFAPAQIPIIQSIERGGILMLSPTNNTLYIFSTLFYINEQSDTYFSTIENTYAVLGYKIDPSKLLQNHPLRDNSQIKIFVNNTNILDELLIEKASIFSTLLDQRKVFQFNDQEVTLYISKNINLFDIELTRPLFVLLTGILLTVLLWYVVRANVIHNFFLQNQNKLIEAEVNKQTKLLKKQASQLEKAYEKQLTATDELKSFSYSISHDLRSPLRAIDGFCQILLEDYSDQLDKTANNYLSRVRTGAQRMGELIDNMLDLAQVTHKGIKYENVSLSKFANEIMEHLQALQPNRNVEINITEGITVTGDNALMHSVMNNLLSNAWKYTSTTEDAIITFTQRIDGDEVIYLIEDNGVGFDMKYANKLFQPFQRLHGDDFSGHGIGLATVARILNRHRGKIWVDSEINQGTTFSFTLGEHVDLTDQSN